ncbi:toll/interleukin-1 receptor domain-containing protein [Brevundimonas diminuta]|uniref:toll/interleukin-1 receptor domain-containing protein n=1 Tax=Brevundimonas diminuta TaxID=293 RepID=UPI003F8143C9
MPVLTDYEVRRLGRETASRTYSTVEKVLRDARQTYRSSFDVFLSHAKLDGELVLGVKTLLEARGISVYVDWIDDPQLDRSRVSPTTAEGLRKRMRQCASLIYVYTRAATNSRWMPWELGYFDAFNGNVAVLPIMQSASESPYRGEEFVGLYPYVDVGAVNMWVHRSGSEYKNFRDWRQGGDKLRPAA